MTLLLSLLASLNVSAATEKKLNFNPQVKPAAHTEHEATTLELPKAPPAMKDASKISFDDKCAGADPSATSRKNLPADSTCAVNAVRNTSQDSQALPGRERSNTSTSGTAALKVRD